MAGCLTNLLKCIWSFIIGSLRMILFFGCLLIVIIQIVMLFASTKSDQLSSILPISEVKPRDHLYALTVLFIGLLGAYGAFYKHLASLKVFVVLLFISTTILTYSMIFTMNPERLSLENNETFSRLQGYFEDYEWNFRSSDQATKSWNTLQSAIVCCGVTGKKDWDKHRPRNLDEVLYPSSCCTNYMLAGPFEKLALCKSDEVFHTGCLERVQQIEAIALLVSCIYITFQVVLFFIALISLAPSSGCLSSSSSGNVEENCAHNYAPRTFQKLEQSVYIRQPPTTNSSTHGLLDERQKYYPDLGHSRYSTPPPSYGASS